MPSTTFVVGPDGRPTIDKKLSAILRYSLDWASWLTLTGGGVTIANSVWTSSVGITLSSPSFNTMATAVLVSGGNVGTVEWATCTVTLNDGQVEVCTLYFTITEK